MRLLPPVDLKVDYPIMTFLKKEKQFFLCKRTNNIHGSTIQDSTVWNYLTSRETAFYERASSRIVKLIL